jgi:hypothetical protein
MSLEIKHAILDVLLTVLDEEHAIGVMDHRKVKKVPLTALAAKILVKQFALCADPNAAAEEMINRGWTGFKADWMRKPSGKAGRRTFADVAMDRFNNGAAGVSRNDAHVGEFSSNERQPGSDSERLRIGGPRPVLPSHH